MRIVEYYQYTLIDSRIPEVVNNVIKSGLLYGGIKLTYTKQKTRSIEFKIFGRSKKLPIKKFKSKEVTFLRPFKQIWDVKNNWLTPNNYGKKKSPYTNIWCELSNGNYDNIMKACTISLLVIRVLHRRIDKELINQLTNKSIKFQNYE